MGLGGHNPALYISQAVGKSRTGHFFRHVHRPLGCQWSFAAYGRKVELMKGGGKTSHRGNRSEVEALVCQSRWRRETVGHLARPFPLLYQWNR